MSARVSVRLPELAEVTNAAEMVGRSLAMRVGARTLGDAVVVEARVEEAGDGREAALVLVLEGDAAVFPPGVLGVAVRPEDVSLGDSL